MGTVAYERSEGGGWKVTSRARLLKEDRRSYGERLEVVAEYRLRATVSADGATVDVQEAGEVEPPKKGVSQTDPMGGPAPQTR